MNHRKLFILRAGSYDFRDNCLQHHTLFLLLVFWQAIFTRLVDQLASKCLFLCEFCAMLAIQRRGRKTDSYVAALQLFSTFFGSPYDSVNMLYGWLIITSELKNRDTVSMDLGNDTTGLIISVSNARFRRDIQLVTLE